MSDTTPPAGMSDRDTPQAEPTRAEPMQADRTPDDAATRKGAKRDGEGDPLRGSRTSGLWIAIVAGGLILVLLIIFIAQNTDPTLIRFLGWEGETPLAVALLIAAAAGLFLATVAGSLRILQLRRRVRRENR